MAAILSQYSTTGFYKAPVSKGLLGCMFLTSCALHVPLLAHAKHYVLYSIPDIFDKLEVWRVVTSKVAFLETKDLVCGSLLVYYFRIFERRYGSHKFASYLLAASTVSTVLELTAVYFLRRFEFSITQLPSGPFGLIFPLFINYFLDIPCVAQTFIMGVPVTGKTLTYLLGMQVMSTSKESMISGACCLVAGMVCRWNLLRVREILRFPSLLASLAKTTLGWLLSSSPPSEGSVPMGATLDIQRQQQVELLEQQVWMARARGNAQQRMHMAQGYAERLVPPTGVGGGGAGAIGGLLGDQQPLWENAANLRQRRNISNGNETETSSATSPDIAVAEDQVQMLVEMGFERQSVVRALRSSHNDVHVATTILLSES